MDKVVLITGASSGIGAGIARELAAAGAKVMLGARRVDRLDALVAELRAAGGVAEARALDVTDRADVEAFAQVARDVWGRVDVIVNNAGVMPLSLMASMKVEEWDRMVDVNIKGVLYGIAAALPYMQAQKSGHVINVASVAGHKVGPGGAVYSATKHAVRVISEGLRQEVKPYNIRTTIISPGAVATELTHTITDPQVKAGMDKTYELAIPADSFGRAVLFAMSQPDDVDINEILFRPTAQVY